MKNWKKIVVSLLTISVLSGISVGNVLAAEESTTPTAPYKYRVTLSAGDKGTINGQTVWEIDANTLSGGPTVTFGDVGTKVTVTDGKYFAKGYRLSGRDNAELLVGDSVKVEEDADYVVAYGIEADKVAYTVNYQDANGNALAPSNTFYGNVGDKPVVAYQYIEGYVPQALALTKTLGDAADNIFTFIYHPGQTGAVTENVTTITTVVPGTAGQNTAGQNAAGQNGAGVDANAQDQETVESPDEDTPQSLVDLDDEETPKSNVKVDKKDVQKGLPLVGLIAIFAASIAALVILIMALKKRRR